MAILHRFYCTLRFDKRPFLAQVIGNHGPSFLPVGNNVDFDFSSGKSLLEALDEFEDKQKNLCFKATILSLCQIDYSLVIYTKLFPKNQTV